MKNIEEKSNKDDLFFYERYPWLPLGISLVALVVATLNLILSFIFIS